MRTNTLGYAISDMLSPLTFKTSLNELITKINLSQWHLIAFFFRKIISEKT